MAAMEGVIQDQSHQQQQPPVVVVAERLNQALQQQLNLEPEPLASLKPYPVFLKTWTAILAPIPPLNGKGQYSIVNLELLNIVDEVKKVSKAVVVHPKNVNAESAAILAVMLSSKLLPEMEVDDNSKREQLLQGLQSLPISSQIEKLKTRIDMIAAACESAEKVLAEQQFRQSSLSGIGQTPLQQLHDLQGQGQQKFQPMQYSHFSDTGESTISE